MFSTGTDNDPRLLYVVGMGVKIPGHTTIAATEALSRCERIYTIVQEPPEVWLPAGRAARGSVVNLMSLYVEGALRSDNYARVAKTILDGLNEASVVGYVTYGNPLSYDSVAQALARAAEHAPWRLEIIPGISSIDTILCDLRLDMAPGIQVYEASWLVASRTPLNTAAAVILLQLGHFGTVRAHYRQRRRAESLADLVSYLSTFYPESHTVMLVQSSGGARPASVAEVKLGELCQVGEKDWAESVYIPPVNAARLAPDVLAQLGADRPEGERF
jgi:precorrin-2 methylase